MGHFAPNFGQLNAKFDPTWSNLGAPRANLKRPWATLGPFGGIFTYLGPMLGSCWPLLGTCLGVHLVSSLKTVFKTSFCLFSTPPTLKNHSKSITCSNDFAFFARSLLKPILDRSGVDFGTKDRSKIGPKRVLKCVENHCCF